MRTRCLLMSTRNRLPLHHETDMMRSLTGFFISELSTYVTQELEGSSSLF